MYFFSYGWAMSKFLPENSFQWYSGDLSVQNITNMLRTFSNESPNGMFLEVDVLYPLNLHDLHNDLPYLPERSIPPGSKIPKLLTTLQSKTNYIVHHTTLIQALNAGLILNKVKIKLYIIFFITVNMIVIKGTQNIKV